MQFGFQEEFLDTRSRDGRNDILLSPLTFVDDDGTGYRAPEFTETDGGSTPRLAWNIPGFEPFGKHWFPWVLHDSGYRGTLLVLRDGVWVKANLSRKECDLLLDRALRSKKMHYILRRAVACSVAIGGRFHFQDPSR